MDTPNFSPDGQQVRKMLSICLLGSYGGARPAAISVLANECQMAPSILTRFVNGERGMSLDSVNTLGAHLGVWIIPWSNHPSYDKGVFDTVMNFRDRREFRVHTAEFLRHLLDTVKQRRGLSWRHYATKIGISHTILSRFMAGKSSLSLDNLDLIFGAHGLSLGHPGAADDLGRCHSPYDIVNVLENDLGCVVETRKPGDDLSRFNGTKTVWDVMGLRHCGTT